MNPIREISSLAFTWSGRSGCAEVSDLRLLNFNPFNGLPITVVSNRTGCRKEFRVNVNVPGYEDGWDGQACYYISADGVEISFYND